MARHGRKKSVEGVSRICHTTFLQFPFTLFQRYYYYQYSFVHFPPLTHLVALTSIALGVVFGAFGATNAAVCNIDFYNTADDELVVNYLKKVRGSLGSDAQDMINILMRKVTRRIPYTK